MTDCKFSRKPSARTTRKFKGFRREKPPEQVEVSDEDGGKCHGVFAFKNNNNI